MGRFFLNFCPAVLSLWLRKPGVNSHTELAMSWAAAIVFQNKKKSPLIAVTLQSRLCRPEFSMLLHLPQGCCMTVQRCGGGQGGLDPPTPGLTPLYLRPIFFLPTPAPLFPFFSGTPAQNSDFSPPLPDHLTPAPDHFSSKAPLPPPP